MATLRDFAVALLDKLGLEPTKNRIMSIVAFGAIEGGHWHNTARFNPMNTMRDGPGATQAAGLLKGIKAYPNWQTGIAATAATIGQSNMRPIAEALKADADPRTFLRAVTESAWCPGCDYTPYDPVMLYAANAKADDAGRTDIRSGGGVGDWMTAWGPYLLGALGLAAAGGVWWYSKKHKKRYALEARERPRKRRVKRYALPAAA